MIAPVTMIRNAVSLHSPKSNPQSDRLLDKLIAANHIADERMLKFVERLGRRTSRRA